MATSDRPLPHIFLREHAIREAFTSPKGGGGKLKLPDREADHADRLEKALIRALAVADAQAAHRDPGIPAEVSGFYLEFEIPTAQASVLDKLEKRVRRGVGIELVSVRTSNEEPTKLAATVFVPNKYRDTFAKKIAEYKDRSQDTLTGKRKNQPLIDSVDTVRLGQARSLFTEPHQAFPEPDQVLWWEVWLRKGARNRFMKAAVHVGMTVRKEAVEFTERDVVLVHGSTAAISKIVADSDAIAELRFARDTPAAIMELSVREQAEWSDNLSERVIAPGVDAPAVCVLDTGSTRNHPLIGLALLARDQQAHVDIWGGDDRRLDGMGGHGTLMCGTALYGDLAPLLRGSGTVTLSHRLETVKIIPNSGANEPGLYGHITANAISKAETAAGTRRRAICLAVTSDAHSWHGRPSQWSGAVDLLAYGYGRDQRLIFISAGNIRDDLRKSDYLFRNDASPIDNPGQSWNALTIGAYTERTTINSKSFRGWQPVGLVGDLSPSSKTSLPFGNDWPIKPDVVFEGGNFAVPNDKDPAEQIDDLALVSTFRRPNERLFAAMGETSAAAALAARMGAVILADRNDLWPETVRGLIVHSAEWTKAMLGHLPKAKAKQKKLTHWRTVVRRYGWGVPDLDRALRSMTNDATIVIEDQLSPYHLDGSTIKTKEMGLHRLPWPTSELEGIGERSPKTDVELRVTLSYFVEPNPGERGWTKRHQYASHGLRFALRHAGESLDRFRRRINKAAGEGEKVRSAGPDKGWVLGDSLRDKGAIHCDIWRGPAASLVDRDAIAVYPVAGWWKEQQPTKWQDRVVRYALVISLRVPSSIDVYTPIATIASRITTPVAIPIQSGTRR